MADIPRASFIIPLLKPVSNAMVELHNSNIIRKMGIQALTKELGAVGMAYFIRQFDQGEGDYTKERDSLLGGLTMQDIENQLRK